MPILNGLVSWMFDEFGFVFTLSVIGIEVPAVLDVDGVRSAIEDDLPAVTVDSFEFHLDLLERKVSEENVLVTAFLHGDFAERIITGAFDLREDTSTLCGGERLGLIEDVLRDLRFFCLASNDRL